MSIPRTAHWIWFGPTLPAWASGNIELFRALHPRWEMRIWHELPAEFPVPLRAIIDQLPWFSSRSDIFRYWLLAKHGGVFLDTDVVPLRQFDPLLEHTFFLAPCQPEGHDRPHLNCALLGSRPGSDAINKILDACLHRAAKSEPARRITYGPDLLTALFEGGSAESTILPTHYFYAIPDRQTAHRFWRGDNALRAELLAPFRAEFSDREEPYALHLWGVDGSSQRRVSAQHITGNNEHAADVAGH